MILYLVVKYIVSSIRVQENDLAARKQVHNSWQKVHELEMKRDVAQLKLDMKRARERMRFGIPRDSTKIEKM